MTEHFQVVVLGCSGGPKENNISGYLVSPAGDDEWVALDCGTLMRGIEIAMERGTLPKSKLTDSTLTPTGEFFLKHIRAYLISHAHLDHISGLVINSQVDQHKSILGIDSTIDNLRDHIFNGRIWPNYGDEGHEPMLKLYHYVRLPLHQEQPIPDTSLTVEAFLLSHPRGYPSSAFLIRKEEAYVLYFGDTSSDSLEIEKHLARVWRRIAPLIRAKELKGMLLECSFSHHEADQAVFGHLDTQLMMREMHHLAEIAQCSLEGFKVIVTHRKETIRSGGEPREEIEEELTKTNDLGIDFIFPSQGDRILL